MDETEQTDEKQLMIPTGMIWRFIAWRMRHAARINRNSVMGQQPPKMLSDCIRGIATDLELLFQMAEEMTSEAEPKPKNSAEDRFLMDLLEQGFREKMREFEKEQASHVYTLEEARGALN